VGSRPRSVHTDCASAVREMGAALRGLGIEASYYAPPSEEETAAATSDDRVARAIAAAGNTL
jgi:hypothetical protein